MVYHNDKSGSFIHTGSFDAGSTISAGTAADVNNNGYDDILLTHYYYISVLTNDGTGCFGKNVLEHYEFNLDILPEKSIYSSGDKLSVYLDVKASSFKKGKQRCISS